MTTAKQHSHFINACLKFGDNLPSKNFLTTATLNAKILIYKTGVVKFQMLTHLPFPGQENISCTTNLYSTLSWQRSLLYRTSSLVCSGNQWGGIYVIGTSVMKELIPRVISHISKVVSAQVFSCFFFYSLFNVDLQ